MDLFDNLLIGAQTAISVRGMFYALIGVVLGTAIGVLPGLGPVAAIAMLLPLTYGLQPELALIMLAGIFYGSQYGGSTTSILVNIPGESSSVVTCLDGHQMARQGRAGTALATAAIGSFFAGTVSTVLIAGFAPVLATIAFRFGPAEYFSLMILGLVGAVALAHGSMVKALGMILIGLLLGLVGTDVTSGGQRFTFSLPDLFDGIDFVAISMGLFGIAEVIASAGRAGNRDILTRRITGLLPSRSDLRRMAPAVLRGTAVGSFLGLLPGGGATLSSFTSYALEKKLSRTPGAFGRGAIEGVAGPESANNAASQTSFIPMLTLGIPSNAVMALMIGAMMMHNITPGPQVAVTNPALFWGLIVSMWFGNLILLVLNLPMIGLWVKVLGVPYRLLFPAIVVLSCIGAYSVNGNGFGILLLAGFGLAGHLFAALECEPAPLLLGFVLGPSMEEYFRRAMLIGDGDIAIFATRPLSAVLLGTAALVLLLFALPAIGRKRAEAFVEGEE
ncbi:tripartite tricarboxylate transporter permease [Azospirillum sp. YIM B02556]|uniref:Tripartite tricarboxylate transporter permease n=1 Tax=Azospirillum endophyticum TaxID=2800326 RepID=A0ABS1F8N3_9PROT|nr:tripartite tricarboxylate transporter permease [Azospirillum endophyticum]MBK1839789.1 tripartite tricarboxylate transporter permease [Azospirillum endophyticum]